MHSGAPQTVAGVDLAYPCAWGNEIRLVVAHPPAHGGFSRRRVTTLQVAALPQARALLAVFRTILAPVPKGTCGGLAGSTRSSLSDHHVSVCADGVRTVNDQFDQYKSTSSDLHFGARRARQGGVPRVLMDSLSLGSVPAFPRLGTREKFFPRGKALSLSNKISNKRLGTRAINKCWLGTLTFGNGHAESLLYRAKRKAGQSASVSTRK